MLDKHGERGEFPAPSSVTVPCSMPSCKAIAPQDLALECLCPLHFTLSVEHTCAELHREIVLRSVSPEYRAEIATYITERGVLLARVALNGSHLSEQVKNRILNTFLSLMVLREILNRHPGREPGKSTQDQPAPQESLEYT